MKRAVLLVLLAGLCTVAAFAGGKKDSPKQDEAVNYDKINIVERAVTVEEFRSIVKSVGSDILDNYTDAMIQAVIDERGMISLPNDTIYTAYPENLELTAQGIEYQRFYQNGNKKEEFEKLITERNLFEVRRRLTEEERALFRQAGGSSIDFDRIGIIERAVTVEEFRAIGKYVGSDILDSYTDGRLQAIIDSKRAMSLPNDTIYIKNPKVKPPKNLTVDIPTTPLQDDGRKKVFEQLVREADAYLKHLEDNTNPNPHTTPGTLEYEAQQVENTARKILNAGKTATSAP